jgi:hypothetical protein
MFVRMSRLPFTSVLRKHRGMPYNVGVLGEGGGSAHDNNV